MSHRLFAALLAACLTVQANTAHALDQYQCVVENFIGFGDDTAFKAKNKRKKFTLLVKSDEIITFVKSREFQDHERTYRITKRALLDTIAIGDMRTSLDTLVIPSRPRRTIERKGYFNATVATQANHYLNTWLLRCVE